MGSTKRLVGLTNYYDILSFIFIVASLCFTISTLTYVYLICLAILIITILVANVGSVLK